MFGKLFAKKKTEEIVSPLEGKVIPIEDIPDEVFSSKAMGDGVGIVPSSNILKAPVAGKIINIIPSKHALIIESKNGTKILIHIGLDTVSLKGEPFSLMVSEGDEVEALQELMQINFEMIKENNLSTITPIVIVEEEQAVEIKSKNYSDKISIGDTLITVQ